MLAIRNLLCNLVGDVNQQKQSINGPVQNNDISLADKIQFVIEKMGGIQVKPELQGSYQEIYNELSVLKGSCAGSIEAAQLSDKIVRIIVLIQNHFDTKEFTDAERREIKNNAFIVSLFRSARQRMALGEFGKELQNEVLTDDAFECIPSIALLIALKLENSIQLDLLKEDGEKMLSQETPKKLFSNMCEQLEQLRNTWQNTDARTRGIVYKQLAGQQINNEEEKIYDHLPLRNLLYYVQEIPDILLQNNKEPYSAIMKGASVSEEVMSRELAKTPVPRLTIESLSSALRLAGANPDQQSRSSAGSGVVGDANHPVPDQLLPVSISLLNSAHIIPPDSGSSNALTIRITLNSPQERPQPQNTGTRATPVQTVPLNIDNREINGDENESDDELVQNVNAAVREYEEGDPQRFTRRDFPANPPNQQ